MPGIRNIGGAETTLTPNAHATVHELYRVLYEFDPDKAPSNSALFGAPLITFDNFIVGRNAETSDEKSSAGLIDEIEIFEYRLMKKQLSWFKQHYPNETQIKDSAYPVLSGPEVITCENTRYSPSNPNDKDRSGIVYSVPFYGESGEFRGMVSGVVLTKVFRDMSTNGSFAIVNEKNNYVVTSNQNGSWNNSIEYILHAQPDPILIYSKVLPIMISDSSETRMNSPSNDRP